MTSTTGVQLRKNDGTEEFNLKCEQVEVNLSNSLITRGILSLGGGLMGADPVLNSVTYQLIGIQIADVDSSDYPAGRVKDSQDGFPSNNASEEQKMENALREAALGWGPDPNASQVFDEFIWNGEEIDVVITSYGATEAAQSPKPGVYVVDMELTHIDAHPDQ